MLCIKTVFDFKSNLKEEEEEEDDEDSRITYWTSQLQNWTTGMPHSVPKNCMFKLTQEMG